MAIKLLEHGQMMDTKGLARLSRGIVDTKASNSIGVVT